MDKEYERYLKTVVLTWKQYISEKDMFILAMSGNEEGVAYVRDKYNCNINSCGNSMRYWLFRVQKRMTEFRKYCQEAGIEPPEAGWLDENFETVADCDEFLAKCV